MIFSQNVQFADDCDETTCRPILFIVIAVFISDQARVLPQSPAHRAVNDYSAGLGIFLSLFFVKTDKRFIFWTFWTPKKYDLSFERKLIDSLIYMFGINSLSISNGEATG